MATDFSDYFAYGALASPERTPEHTPPELSVRKPSSRSRTPRDFSIKSAPLPSFDSPDSHNGSVHGLDPNRFTPSLHASLVSEILSLRRELDSKHRFIDNLEDGFKTVQSENETLSEHLRESNKKSRHLEHKFKNLENGTFDAVEGLLAERDSFKHANQELRTRLERVSKKLKTLEDDKIQSKTLWDKERQDWVNEKRQLEQKAHISETRLRRVIEEMNAQQNALINQHRRDDNSGDSDVASMHSYRMSKHTRNQSSMSTRSFNRSVGGGSRLGMTSLANELNSDDEEYDTEDLELEEDDLPLIAGNRLSMYSRTSKSSDSKAKKILGLTMSTTPEPSSEDDGRTAPADSARGPSIAARFGLHMPKVGLKSSDTSRTSSRSTSPATSARQNDTPASDPPNAAITKWTPDAKISPPTQVSNHKDAVKQATNTRMPSSSTTKRIAEAPISPPDTPELVQAVDAGIKIQTKLNYQTASTQTDVSVNQGLALRRTAPVAPLEVPQIPAITIQPPMSPSFGDAILPPGVRSMSVQTDHTSNTSMRDAGMQTEEIKVDQRSIKLPPHLLPSALDYDENKESTLRHVDQELKGITKYKPIMHRSTFSKDGNRLPLKAMDLPPPRLRSLSQERRQQSGYAAYKEADDYSHYRSADSGTTGKSGQSRDGNIEKTPENRAGPIRPSVRTMLNGLPKTVPENREISPAYMNATADRRLPSVPGQPKESVGNHFRSRPSSSRGSVTTIRTAPFFSSRERDPGRPSSTGSQSGKAHAPPFPIPGRISSRPLSHDGPQSPTRRDVLSLRSQQSGKGTRYAPEGGLRKVQSSGTMRTDTHMSPRRRRRGPNLEPIRSVAFDAPSMNNLLPPGVSPPGHGHLQSPSNPLFDLDSPDFDRDSAVEEEEEKTQDNAIVDAIAATMVGEWMWKYVRRRRSFGLGESRGDQIDDGAGSSGIRHKRWVWLSPYEHTVMWSAKQPNSGPALLGKAGRKLIIKSVLDVKDPTPLHKSASHEPVFDRSILILTPERALKFTASNREKHYLWLTALSFLAQSGRGPPQVPRVSPTPETAPGPDRRGRSSLMPLGSGQGQQPARSSIGPVPPAVRVEAPQQRCGTADSTAPRNISRLPVGVRHQRKRSSTNPHQLSPNESAGSIFARRSSNTAAYRPPLNNSARSSIRASERTSFFDAVGTVRMDAFIGAHAHGNVDENVHPAGLNRESSRYSSITQDMMAGKGYRFGEHEVDPFAEF